MGSDIKSLREWKKLGKKIAVFCAGRHGVILFELLGKCNISADCFFDSAEEKWGKRITDGCICINPRLVGDKDSYMVFIGVAPRYYDEVRRQALSMGYRNIADLNGLTDDIIVNHGPLYLELIEWFSHFPPSEFFYTLKQAESNIPPSAGTADACRPKTAVYTGSFGGYDDICRPAVRPGNIDYYYISDEEPEELYHYVWIDAKKFIPPEIRSPIKRNRYMKMHPHIFFPDYQYSIYVDGNIEIKGDISCFLPSGGPMISVFLHPTRDCLFYEGITIVNFGRVAAADVCRQMRKYLEEGMPVHYGLAEMGVMARKHMDPMCVRVMEKWWDEFDKGAQRDQLSFMYAMWKNGLGIGDVCPLGTDCRRSPLLKIKKHIADSRAVLNVSQVPGWGTGVE